jgi:Periplasmic binding protein
LLLLFSVNKLSAQDEVLKTVPTFKVGIFAPLYLDSVFNEKGFRYKQAMPKFIMPAVDFVQGAQVALDSLVLWGANVEASIYDSKAYRKTIVSLIKNGSLDSLDLIIGAVKDAEYKQLADFALQKNKPFISATYPNDGGITGNPFTVIVNSTLKAHCEAIYSYILQEHSTNTLLFCRQKGQQEDKIAAYFKMMNEQDGKPLLNIQTINFDSIGAIPGIVNKLDSNREAIIIGGSLDEKFATALAKTCYDISDTYSKNTLIGMPNWYSFKIFNSKDALEDFPVYYTSPYFNNKWDSYSKKLISLYTKKYKTKPTDMAYKGFELTYLFTKLLTRYPSDMMSNLNDKAYKVFCDYNFKPVMLKKDNAIPDYIENKHLYFVRMLNGKETKAW